MGRRSGFSLVEMLIVVIIIGVMSLMAYPRVNRSMIKSDLRGARTRLANMFALARAAATQNSRTATYVKFNGNTAVVTATPRRTVGAGTEDTIGVAVNVSTAYSATLNTNGLTQVKFDPRGWGTMTGPTTAVYLMVTRSGYRDSIQVNTVGRVIQ